MSARIKGITMTYYQLNMFDDPQDSLTEYEKCLAGGTGFAGGKIRVFAACMTLPNSDLPKFLKEEYGVGGRTIGGGCFDYSAKGLEIYHWNSNDVQTYKWNQAAKDIKRLISLDLYLTDREKKIIEIIKNNHDGILPTPTPRYHYE
jgi:hypothetical protein